MFVASLSIAPHATIFHPLDEVEENGCDDVRITPQIGIIIH